MEIIKIVLVAIFLLTVSCQKKENMKPDQIIKKGPPELVITSISDTLNSDTDNKVIYEYNSEFKDFTINQERFIKLYYVIQDSEYKGRIEDLRNYKYDSFKDMNTVDTLRLRTFGEKGEKYITFIFLDLIEKPQGDSAKLEYIETKFVHKTFIK